MAVAHCVFFLLCGICGLMTGGNADAVVKVPSCPKGFTRVDDRCFKFIHSERTFADAQLTCECLGADLASVTSDVENEILLELITIAKGDRLACTWIGYNDINTDGTFVWTDGTPRDFENFRNGEPNDNGPLDCVKINGDADAADPVLPTVVFWDAVDCDEEHYFLCSKCPE
ncbi:galactose-specific lectin nattectin-like [Nerophis lumbriciformis]|uniref:galactose-specific lectin nattectin-like n=1 Tax=Nerophis lumbriciformis TaxID=546530 RepID=UPI002ADF2B68|nr:galactose-specific lectin nattectin-like [Nerophis lumbriciformis]